MNSLSFLQIVRVKIFELKKKKKEKEKKRNLPLDGRRKILQAERGTGGSFDLVSLIKSSLSKPWTARLDSSQ